MFLICLYYCDARTISSEIAHSLLCLYSIFSSEYLIYGLHAFVCLVAHNLFQYCYVWIVVSSFRESDIQSSAMFPLNFFSPLFCSVFQSAVIVFSVQSFFLLQLKFAGFTGRDTPATIYNWKCGLNFLTWKRSPSVIAATSWQILLEISARSWSFSRACCYERPNISFSAVTQ